MSDSPPLDSKIASWLDSQGYPLEMRTAQAFRASGLRVIQSEYFSDPETKTSREIDVVASVDAEVDSYFVRASFVVECKSSRDKPWVLFAATSGGLAPPARVVQRSANLPGHRLLKVRGKDKALHENDLFQIHGTPAHGVTQAFTSGSDAAYAAVHGAAKAAAALALDGVPSKRPIFQVLFPVVVIDARLFECSLTDGNQIEVTEVSEGTLVWRNPVVEEPHTIIDIVTLPFLATYVQRARQGADAFLSGNAEACQGILSSAKADPALSRKLGWVRSW